MYQDNFTSAVYSDKFALVLTYSLTYIVYTYIYTHTLTTNAEVYINSSCLLPAMNLAINEIQYNTLTGYLSVA